jgi:hypothetical protein
MTTAHVHLQAGVPEYPCTPCCARRDGRLCHSWKAFEMLAVLLINVVVGPGRLYLTPLYQVYLVTAIIMACLTISFAVGPYSTEFKLLELYAWWMWGVLAGICSFLAAELSSTADGDTNSGTGLMTLVICAVFMVFVGKLGYCTWRCVWKASQSDGNQPLALLSQTLRRISSAAWDRFPRRNR